MFQDELSNSQVSHIELLLGPSRFLIKTSVLHYCILLLLGISAWVILVVGEP